MTEPFTLWLTGLPASGKSSITKVLVRLLHDRDVDPVVLESDTFRKYFTPDATHSEADRVLFYRGMVEVARLFTAHGVPVILDATGNRRSYRAPAREYLAPFAEVLVDCPLEICVQRDPKGIYQKGRSGAATTVPGLQVEYEAPLHPELHLRSDRQDPESAARTVLDFLICSNWIPSKKMYRV